MLFVQIAGHLFLSNELNAKSELFWQKKKKLRVSSEKNNYSSNNNGAIDRCPKWHWWNECYFIFSDFCVCVVCSPKKENKSHDMSHCTRIRTRACGCNGETFTFYPPCFSQARRQMIWKVVNYIPLTPPRGLRNFPPFVLAASWLRV